MSGTSAGIGKHDEKAERAVIGACLIGGPEVCDVALGMLKERDFYNGLSRTAFSRICAAVGGGRPADEVSLAGGDSSFGDFLFRCTRDCPSAANIESYCETVRSLSLSRALQELSLRIQQGVDRNEKPEEILATFGKETDRMQARLAGRESEPVEVSVLAKRITGELGPATRFSGLPCGLGDGVLDVLTDGWERGTYTVLAARTSLGKSTAAMAIARGVRRLNPQEGCPLIINTEMSEKALARKDLACVAGISAKELKHSNLDRFQKQRIVDVVKSGEMNGVFLTSMPGASIDSVRAIAKRHARKHGLPIIVIDLLQQLGSPFKEKDPTQHLSYLSGQMGQLAIDLNCAVLVCHQVNRSVAQEEDRRPGLTHLKGSGSMEEDPSKVIFIHRPGYWGQMDNRTEFILAKDRDLGNVGSCFVQYDKSTGRFVDATFAEEKKK